MNPGGRNVGGVFVFRRCFSELRGSRGGGPRALVGAEHVRGDGPATGKAWVHVVVPE